MILRRYCFLGPVDADSILVKPLLYTGRLVDTGGTVSKAAEGLVLRPSHERWVVRRARTRAFSILHPAPGEAISKNRPV